MNKSAIVEKPLHLLWLLHSGPPMPGTLNPQHRESLLQKLRDNFLDSVVSRSPIAGSELLAEAIDEDPHLSPFKTATLIEPVLIFPCSDGIVVVGGLQGGRCLDHGHPLVSSSVTSLPEKQMPKELREPWEAVRNPALTLAQCVQTLQHTGAVFHGFYLHVQDHNHEHKAGAD